ncbi:MAG: hypothetical protein OEY79_05190, partial [Anaplasmataceae bacterium]|nr:hypothetical protein [Anaplasmataceae bacterium]
MSLVDTINNSNGLFFYYLRNSIVLTVSVTLISTIIGTVSAYIVTFFNFRCRLIFQLALILPVAIPSYISALSYSYALEFAGPIQTFLRDSFHINIAPYFNIRSMGGCIFIMSIASFPYVYITSMNAMYKTKHLVDIARTFNKNFMYIFFKIIIPVCKKQIIAGGILVFMEVLSDFATCQMLAVDTINNAIYKGWFLSHNPPYAARISLFILTVSIIILYIKKEYVKNYRIDKIKSQNLYYRLPRKNNLYIYFLMISIACLSFIFPLLPLIKWSFIPASVDLHLIKIIKNTLIITTLATVITTFISLLLVINKKNNFSFFCQIGFGLPKSIISIGMISFFTV